jgi:hypothetical protein
MANHDPEYISNEIDKQHAVHARATGKPSQAGVAEGVALDGGLGEALGWSPKKPEVKDSTLSWGGGEHVASQAWGDDIAFPAGPAGTDATTIKATPPSDFGKPVTPVSSAGAEGNWNMDKIASTPINNPDTVRSRR